MIKREIIKQAIDAISRRSPDIGYSLDEMLGVGLIDAPPKSDMTVDGDEFWFLFENQIVPVTKYVYIHEATVPIEQSLLIKYGETLKKQELEDEGNHLDYRVVAREIRSAGLRFMVTHEIDYALARLRESLGRPESRADFPSAAPRSKDRIRSTFSKTGRNTVSYQDLILFLEKLKHDSRCLDIGKDEADPAILFRGLVDISIPAYFIRFPYCMDSLMQVAEANMEFFHVRFLLNCLLRGLERNLFACVVQQRIVGLTYLIIKYRGFYKQLYGEYIATLRGRSAARAGPSSEPPLKGVGTFLLAGVWLLWKNVLVGIKELVIDTEVEARHVYESAGFQSRGLSVLVLNRPKGYLLKSILVMINNCRDLRLKVIKEIEAIIKRQIKALRKKAKSDGEKSARKVVIEAVKECLKSRTPPELSKIAVTNLLRYKKKIPESEELMQFALKHASGEIKAYIRHAAGTCR